MGFLSDLVGVAAPIVGGIFGGPVGAAIGAGIGGIAGAAGSASAQRDATRAQVQGQEAGIAEQARQFDVTQQNLQPSLEAGNLAREQQLALLGLRGEEAFQGATSLSPGQQFLENRAQKNLLRNASAIGGLGGGNIRSALVEQGAGFGAAQLQNQFTQLGQVAGQGQAAGTTIGQLGGQASSGISRLLEQGGLTRASGIQGGNQIGQQFGQIGSQLAGRLFPAQLNPNAAGAVGLGGGIGL